MNLSKAFQTRRSHKYNAKRTVIAGESYRSKLESEVHATLKLMERAGKINNIRREQAIHLTPSITHKLDFLVFDIERGIDIGIEAKGISDGVWSVKKRLYKDLGPFPIQIWMKKGNRVYMDEEIPAGKYTIQAESDQTP